MKKKSIILLIVLLAIGFAAVSTTLIINGTIGVQTYKDGFIDGLVFDDASLRTSNNNMTAEVSISGRTLSFTTQTMTSVDETATVYFKIKNYSQYDAKLGTPAFTCYFVSDHQVDKKATAIADSPYMKLIEGHELDGDTILAGGNLSEESSVTVKQIKSSVDNNQEIKFQCEINATAGDSATPSMTKPPVYNVTFNANGGNAINETKNIKYGQKYGELPTPTNANSKMKFLGWYTEVGEKVTSTTIVNIQESHTLKAYWYELSKDKDENEIADVGDEITVGTESFHIISNNGETLNGLAMYNLNVGNNKNDQAPEGIQHESVKGYVSSGTTYGNVAFSKTYRWTWDNNGTIDIRNDSRANGPVKNALYGTNGYETYIKQSIPNASIRLITNSELLSLGCSDDNGMCTSAPNWVYSTTYWTQSAYTDNDDIVFFVDTDGNFYIDGYENDTMSGVRPVIEIPLN